MTDEAAKAASKENPDATWQKLMLASNKTIAEAENHLGVSHGIIADVWSDTDYLATLKISATIEPLLNELLEKNVTRALSHPKVSFPGGDTLAEFILNRNIDEKRKLALKFELISESVSTFISCVMQIRNRYAHNVKNVALSIAEIADKQNPADKGAKLLRGLYGAQDAPLSILSENFMRALLFFNFANFLSIALAGIKPPSGLGLFDLALMHDSADTEGAENQSGNGEKEAGD